MRSRRLIAAVAWTALLLVPTDLAADDVSRLHARAMAVAKPPGSWILLLHQDGAAPADTEWIGIGVPALRNGESSFLLGRRTAKDSLMTLFNVTDLSAWWGSFVRARPDSAILRWPPTTCPTSEGNDGASCEENTVPSPAPSGASGGNIATGVVLSRLEAPARRALSLGGAGGLAVMAIIGFAFLVKARVNRPFRARAAADEERFRFMADTVPSILFVTDADGYCEYVNQRFYEYTGMAPGSALGLGWVNAVHPEEQRRVVDNFVRPAPANDLRLSEMRLRARDGSYRWFLGRSRPSRDANGNVVKWFGSSSDIDDIKQSGAALRRINERLSAVLSSIDECYYTIDRQWCITDINPNAASFFGKAPEDLIGRSIYEVVPELRETDLEADFAQALGDALPMQLEYRSRVEPEQWLAVNCYPWTEGLSVFFRDVTRQKAAEIALRRTQELLQQTMDALSAQIAILDDQGIILAANAAWRRLAGGMACGIGCNYIDAVPELVPDAAQVQQIAGVLKAVLQEAQRDGLVYYARPADKGSRWFQMRATRFDSGQGLRVVVAHEDITEIKEAERGLRDLTSRLLRVQDDERRRMARELHDTTAQNLAAAILELDRLQRSVRTLDQASENAWDDLRALIDNALQEIRTLSYLLHPPLLDELGLASALRWYVRGFESRSGVAVSFTIKGDLGRMPAAVESALFRVVQEALTNIHRHSGSATAQIDLTRSADQVVLEIRDQGRGMPRHHGADPALLGVGVSGMRARLHQLGGELSIQSSRKGTAVTAAVWLEQASDCRADELASSAISE